MSTASVGKVTRISPDPGGKGSKRPSKGVSKGGLDNTGGKGQKIGK